MLIDAWHHNALATEVKAIEGFLGPNGQNIAGAQFLVFSKSYDFAAQTPGGSLIAGNNSITLSPVPKGVNGTDVCHYLYISGGTGTPEAVRITGGTAVSGATSGTVIVTCAYAHSGAWTIRSATAGIQEAIQVTPAQGGIIRVPAGQYTIYGPTCVQVSNIRIIGDGFYTTWLETTYTGGTLFDFEGGTGNPAGGNSLESMTIVGPNNSASTNYAVSIDNQVHFFLRYLNISQVANGIRIVNNSNSDALSIEQTVVSYFNGIAYNILGSNSQTFVNVSAISGTTGTSIGFQVTRTGALTIRGGYTFHVGYGMLINPTEFAANIWVSDLIVDTGSNDGIRFYPSGTGYIESAVFINTWTSACTGNGVYMETVGTAARIEAIQFLGHRAIINSYGGFVIRGKNVKKITISNCDIKANSVASPNASDGIFIVPDTDGPDGITIVNNDIGSNSQHISFQRFAINFGYGTGGGATDNVIVTGNRCTPGMFITLAGQMRYIEGLDVITGNNIVAKDNTPGANLSWPASESAGTLNLGGSSVSMYSVSGTSAISDIQPAWNGREIYLTKTDVSGAKTFNTAGTIRNAITLNDGETLRAVYDGAKWNLIK
jgi:hypothetical protein